MRFKAKGSTGRSLVLVVMAFGLSCALAPSAQASPVLSKETRLTAQDVPTFGEFGRSVAVSGDSVVVGAPAFFRHGYAYLFARDGDGWSYQGRVTGSLIQTPAIDHFGAAVAIDSDTVVVGAPGERNRGAVWIFKRDGRNLEQRLALSDGSAFGQSVAVSGSTLLVGGLGAAYVFEKSGGVWVQSQKLTLGDAAAGGDFGSSVALSGDSALVGSPGYFPGISYPGQSGSAHVFVRSGGVWSEAQELTAGAAGEDAPFGFAVALSGDTAVVGAPGDASVPGSLPASAHVFVRSGGVFSRQQKLTAGAAPSGDGFGLSVAVSGDTAVVGADLWQDDGSITGSAIVFVRSAGVWSEQQRLTARDEADRATFGSSVSASGGTVVVGAPGDSMQPDGYSGSSYVYEPGLARVWVGLGNSDDVGIRFDLLAKVFVNGSLFASGELKSVLGGSSGFNNAKLNAIPLTLSAPVAVSSGDSLSVEVLVRNACSGSGKNSGKARLWYNGNPVDSGSRRDAGTRFDAVIGLSEALHFLRGNLALSTTSGSSKLFIDKPVGVKCGAFTSFGTWSTTLP